MARDLGECAGSGSAGAVRPTIQDAIDAAARARVDPREFVASCSEHMEREAFRRLGQLLGEINDDILVADDRDRLIDEVRD